ncbi:amidohydrolase family protein [Kribbella sp. NBC_01484]|uniref:amidohydrolase family protein n=1 Tax=Kribbella sp. NBC_01484 TaxID=2903579 RepID=UPI002E320677|nr:amidohydrolase family protein [Kribbella sp. NBC_01484]
MAGHRVTPAGHDTAADSSAEVISELRRRIREHWEGFSPAARSVCRALSERSAEQLVFVSAAELGAETKTSNATVVRTVQGDGRFHPEQAITIDEALRAYTANPAFSSHEEDVKGTITPGKLADLVVLSEDIRGDDPSVLLRARVEQTYLGGRLVHSRLA